MTRKEINFLDGDFNLPKLEERVLKFWDENKIFEKSLGSKGHASGGTRKEFIFYEGPPYANGKPGIHHILARVVKDVILRYKTMRGYSVPRRAGWDTHGLPVEMAAEKALGLKSKRDIEKLGVKVFNEKAKEQVWIHKDEWENLTRRIGYWLDLKNAYVTYAPEYIETIWWTIAQISKRGLLSKGHKVVPWCVRCGTALSSHELAQGYKEVVDNSVYIKFKLKPGQKIGKFTTDDRVYVLSWTTTPWTLPGNLALAVGKNISYSILRADGAKEIYIVASDLVKIVFGDRATEVVRDGVKGADLVGIEYDPLFAVKPLHSGASYKIYPADFVTTTEGTGVVHTAVMYGEDDYVLGKKLDLPQHHTVDEEGRFTKDVAGLAGLGILKEGKKDVATEKKIIEHLERNGNLLRVEPYTHEYPHCWRCDTPVLYYARTSWFVEMSKLRRELLARNKKINWMPAHVRDGRFGEWLREVKDWNLSRERYWGAPLPIWECGKCLHTEVVGGLDELSRLAGGPKNSYWVMRHGEAESNVFHIVDSGQRKFLHLTARGRKQAEAAIKKFKTKIDVVISSDVTRAHETEEIVAAVLKGERVKFDKRLEEIHLGPALTGYRDDRYGKLYPTYESRFEKRPEGGESLRDVRLRAWKLLEEYESKYEGKNILLVTHEYPIWMLSHTAGGWSEKRAVREKEARKGDFVDFAEIRKLDLKIVPRNDSGEVDLHRPFADVLTLKCEKCGDVMKRVPGVADVWYDSGAMPYAQEHFPFSLGATAVSSNPKPEKSIAFPADYIAEGMDQTRGWFYTMLAIATALGYEAPYRNVITFGLINDKFGQKMSKSRGNVVDPWMIIDKYGTDAVRWYFFTGTPFGEPKNFDENDIAKAFRKTHLIVYNSFIFWKTYAQSGALKNSKNILDKWILARLAELIDSVTKKLDKYEIRDAALAVDVFVDDLSRWYIRRSRRRLQRPENVKDYEAASATLQHVLLSLTKLMAPFTPFFSEVLYHELGGSDESIHLDEWPRGGVKAADKKLVMAMGAVRDLAAAGLAKRAEAGIKVRQPLASMSVGTKLEKDLRQVLADEVNVKEIVFSAELKDGVQLDTKITESLREEGLVREVARMVQELRQRAGLQPKDKVVVMLQVPAAMKNAITKNENILKSDVGAKSIEYGRPEKFDAEETIKIDGEEARVAVRKV